MKELQFFPDDFKVSYAGETKELLPKEFALLEFLCRHKNHTFSREELLNAVWPPLDEPTDRTVDDHIYRLRKKLKHWEHLLTIETIRGRGYRLLVKTPQQSQNPLTQDPDYMEQLINVINKFQQYGQYDAMRMTVEQQKSLGIETIPFYSTYSRFASGDLQGLLDDDNLAIEEKLYYLLTTYSKLQPDLEKSLVYYERTLERKILLPPLHREFDILDVTFLYVFSGHTEQAIARLPYVHEVVRRDDMEGFRIPAAILDAYAYFIGGEDKLAAEKISQVEAMAEQVPYLREKGTVRVLKGLWLLSQQRKQEAASSLHEGLQIIHQTQFVPYIILSYWNIRHTLRLMHGVDEFQRLYEKKWEELLAPYPVEKMIKKMETIFAKHLF